MADLEQFSVEEGGEGAWYGGRGKSERVITRPIYQHSTPITRSLSPENYPLKCRICNVTSSGTPLEPRPIFEIGSGPILKHQISNIAESPPDNLSAMNIKVDIKIPEEASFVISRTKKVKYPSGEKGIPIPHEDDVSQ